MFSPLEVLDHFINIDPSKLQDIEGFDTLSTFASFYIPLLYSLSKIESILEKINWKKVLEPVLGWLIHNAIVPFSKGAMKGYEYADTWYNEHRLHDVPAHPLV